MTDTRCIHVYGRLNYCFQLVFESEFFKIPTASIHQVTALICKANKLSLVNQSHHLMKFGNNFEFHISLQTYILTCFIKSVFLY